MGSVYVVKRMTKAKDATETEPAKPAKPRYHVRYQSRAKAKAVQLGIFPTETLAKKRVQWAIGVIANGGVPTNEPVVAPVVDDMRTVAERWLERRMKIADSTRLSLQNSIGHINERFGSDDPQTITVDEIQDWISDMHDAGAKTGTIRNRMSCLKMILKHAKVRPNPAADEDIELPRSGPKRNRLPSSRELAAFYGKLPDKYQGVVRLMEHSGLRVHEAVAVRHEDWDRRKRRLLVPDSKTYAGERFVDQIDGLPTMPDRSEGRVWPSITVDGVQAAMRKACERAEIRTFSPHDLRKLHISRCLRSGMDPSLLAVRAGHSSPVITLGVYSKLIPPE